MTSTSSLKAELKRAGSIFVPTLKWTTLSVAAAHLLGALYLCFAHFTPILIFGVLLAPVWGALLGGVLGVLLGLLLSFLRLAGPMKWLPIILMPLLFWGTMHLAEPLIDAQWHRVATTQVEFSGGGGTWARVGPIALVIAIPLLIIALAPLAAVTIWALLTHLFFIVLGLMLGAVITVPPVLIAIAYRLGKRAYRDSKQARETPG